jgi:hypothetical protein
VNLLCLLEVTIEKICGDGQDDGNYGDGPSKDTGKNVINLIICRHTHPITGVIVVIATELRVWELNDEQTIATGGGFETLIFQICAI